MQILPGVLLAVIGMTAVAVKVASDFERTSVDAQTVQIIAAEAARFDAKLQRAQATARALAAAVEADQSRDRARASPSRGASPSATPTWSARGWRSPPTPSGATPRS